MRARIAVTITSNVRMRERQSRVFLVGQASVGSTLAASLKRKVEAEGHGTIAVFSHPSHMGWLGATSRRRDYELLPDITHASPASTSMTPWRTARCLCPLCQTDDADADADATHRVLSSRLRSIISSRLCMSLSHPSHVQPTAPHLLTLKTA
ncbi:hypothetical protein BS50DRAFT_408209 [Corynespora cassiicola Philippines]|uniref:Uncharacterized protein n=1 Tax=Corynespora cassiicola Philippines TaxID=1448308 RepID=A0A2T2NLK2_CORCC|nr:hypothetical protein BS50DRAFT_408209 [Corynespora cassiicola Philippines]